MDKICVLYVTTQLSRKRRFSQTKWELQIEFNDMRSWVFFDEYNL